MDAPSATAQLAEQIAERLRAEEALRLSASRLEHLHRISLAILSADSLTAVVQIAVSYIEEAIVCLAAGISLYDPEHDEVAIVGSTSNFLPSGSRLPITQPDALDAIAQGHIYIYDDIGPLAADSPGLRRLAEMGGRSVLGVPVRAGETLLGAMWITTAKPQAFTVEEVAVAHQRHDGRRRLRELRGHRVTRTDPERAERTGIEPLADLGDAQHRRGGGW